PESSRAPEKLKASKKSPLRPEDLREIVMGEHSTKRAHKSAIENSEKERVREYLASMDKARSEIDAAEYAGVLAHAVETFGSRTNANAWLNKPNRVFHNQAPLQILTEDPAAVEEELVRIDHGMFI